MKMTALALALAFGAGALGFGLSAHAQTATPAKPAAPPAAAKVDCTKAEHKGHSDCAKTQAPGQVKK